MAIKLQLRRDTAANWTSSNPTLSQGEAGVETDTDKFKIGDGTTAWTSLAYANGVTPSSADTFTNKSGSNSQWTNDEGYITDYTVTEGDVTTHEAAIDHDALTNFVANEHIDWTADQGATNINAANYTDTDTTDHTALSNIGTNTHAQIDSHIADTTGDPHAIASDTLTFTNKTFDANGTGNSLSNVDVADLADGTDGELITWDSSGSPATVGAGTADQVLTSNGAGAAPTFQDAAAGGSATKEFYIPWIDDSDNSSGGTRAEVGSWSLSSANTGDDWWFNFKVPNDFTSITSAQIICIADATETVQFDVTTNFGAIGEDYNANTDSITDGTQAVTINKISALDISAALTNIAADDFVGVLFESDTSDIRIAGFRFKYS